MNALYRDQASGYDDFRERFLHGRDELVRQLDLPAGAHVVELGGGTGRNLERFGDKLAAFGSATVVDFCAPLLDVARDRAARLGWTNVHLVEGDATTWRPDAPVDCVYLSYSMTMIPKWFAVIENALAMLKPGGLLGVVDFYVSHKRPAEGRTKHGAVGRRFWRWWFAHDDVFLSPDHADYLEYRTEKRHHVEHRGKVPYLPLLRAPYFVYVGRKPVEA